MEIRTMNNESRIHHRVHPVTTASITNIYICKLSVIFIPKTGLNFTQGKVGLLSKNPRRFCVEINDSNETRLVDQFKSFIQPWLLAQLLTSDYELGSKIQNPKSKNGKSKMKNENQLSDLVHPLTGFHKSILHNQKKKVLFIPVSGSQLVIGTIGLISRTPNQWTIQPDNLTPSLSTDEYDSYIHLSDLHTYLSSNENNNTNENDSSKTNDESDSDNETDDTAKLNEDIEIEGLLNSAFGKMNHRRTPCPGDVYWCFNLEVEVTCCNFIITTGDRPLRVVYSTNDDENVVHLRNWNEFHENFVLLRTTNEVGKASSGDTQKTETDNFPEGPANEQFSPFSIHPLQPSVGNSNTIGDFQKTIDLFSDMFLKRRVDDQGSDHEPMSPEMVAKFHQSMKDNPIKEETDPITPVRPVDYTVGANAMTKFNQALRGTKRAKLLSDAFDGFEAAVEEHNIATLGDGEDVKLRVTGIQQMSYIPADAVQLNTLMGQDTHGYQTPRVGEQYSHCGDVVTLVDVTAAECQFYPLHVKFRRGARAVDAVFFKSNKDFHSRFELVNELPDITYLMSYPQMINDIELVKPATDEYPMPELGQRYKTKKSGCVVTVQSITENTIDEFALRVDLMYAHSGETFTLICRNTKEFHDGLTLVTDEPVATDWATQDMLDQWCIGDKVYASPAVEVIGDTTVSKPAPDVGTKWYRRTTNSLVEVTEIAFDSDDRYPIRVCLKSMKDGLRYSFVYMTVDGFHDDFRPFKVDKPKPSVGSIWRKRLTGELVRLVEWRLFSDKKMQVTVQNTITKLASTIAYNGVNRFYADFTFIGHNESEDNKPISGRTYIYDDTEYYVTMWGHVDVIREEPINGLHDMGLKVDLLNVQTRETKSVIVENTDKFNEMFTLTSNQI